MPPSPKGSRRRKRQGSSEAPWRRASVAVLFEALLGPHRSVSEAGAAPFARKSRHLATFSGPENVAKCRDFSCTPPAPPPGALRLSPAARAPVVSRRALADVRAPFSAIIESERACEAHDARCEGGA